MKTSAGHTTFLAAIMLTLIACSSTGHITIAKPSADGQSLSSPLSIRVKLEGCGQPVPGSFSAWINKGKENQQDISERFTLSGNEWVAQDVRLGRGTHTLEVDAEIEGQGCSKSYSRSRQVRDFEIEGGEELELTLTLPSAATIVPATDRTTIVAVQDGDGDAAHVVLTAATLPGVTEVALEVIEPRLANIPASAILLSFRITPEATRLAHKGQILISSASAERLSRSLLYFVKANGRLLPLPNQSITGGVLIADIHHFSTFVVADLSAEQFAAQVDRASPDGTYEISAGMEVFEEQIQTDIEIAQQAQMLGSDTYADEVLEDIKESVESAIQARIEETPSEERSCESTGELVSLSVLGEQVGVSETTDAALQDYANKCLKNGTLASRVVLTHGSFLIPMECHQALPFEHRAGRLSGGGQTNCTLQWQYDTVEGGVILDFDILNEFGFEGESAGFELNFRPPTVRSIGGHGRITVVSPELGTIPILDTQINEGEVVGDVFLLGRLTYPSPEDSLGYDLRFVVKQNDTFQHIETFDGALYNHTWRLCINGAPEARIDVPKAALKNKNNEIALGRANLELSLTNWTDQDCTVAGSVANDHVDETKTTWTITGVDAKQSKSPTVKWDSNAEGRADIKVAFDDQGSPNDDAPAEKSIAVTVVKPTGETNESKGWGGVLGPTLHEWESTLESDSGVIFDGIEVTEKDPGTGVDECWNKLLARTAPGMPVVPVTLRGFQGIRRLSSESSPQVWVVGNAGRNKWCCDKNFVHPDVIEYYQSKRVTPCTIRLPQDMHVVVPNKKSVAYDEKNVIEYIIRPNEVQVCRHGVCSVPLPWP